MGDEGESESVTVTSESSKWVVADGDGREEELEDLDMSNDPIYHSEPFEGSWREFDRT